jgi:hypothetical protein
MTDLDGVTYPTRNKTDLVQNERELYLILRMEPTLTLEDFVTRPQISKKSTACPSNNIGMVSALKNLQLIL